MNDPFLGQAPKQVGGDHYEQLKIEPWDIAKKNKLDVWEHGVTKYTLRHRRKNGKEDLYKAIDYLNYMIENYEELYGSSNNNDIG